LAVVELAYQLLVQLVLAIIKYVIGLLQPKEAKSPDLLGAAAEALDDKKPEAPAEPASQAASAA
jgi:hypothetical protein